jgi:hypothetical protein
MAEVVGAHFMLVLLTMWSRKSFTSVMVVLIATCAQPPRQILALEPCP